MSDSPEKDSRSQDPSIDSTPMGLAFEWVGRITAVALEMVLPGLLGKYLDDRWGTNFLVLVGFGLGLSLAMFHLLVMTRATRKK